jgi:fused signal recognition particle receptor
MKKLWSRLTGGLQKTRSKLANGIEDLVRRRPKLDDELFDELEEILISADVGPSLTEEIVEKLREVAKSQNLASTVWGKPLPSAS